MTTGLKQLSPSLKKRKVYMDVRQYYRKLREIESGITEPYLLVTSLETSDGGKPGIISEVSREDAAKLIIEGRVTRCSEIDEKLFFAKRAADKRAIEKAEMAHKLQVTIVSAPDDKDVKGGIPTLSESGSRK